MPQIAGKYKLSTLYASLDGGAHRAAAGKLEDTELAFETQKFRSIVFDYDGTLSSSNDNDRLPSPKIVENLIRLLEGAWSSA